MADKKKVTEEKSNFHERNKHRSRYDFDALTKALPALSNFVAFNKYGDKSVDFANPDAVKTLNRALLKYFYKVEFWDIPEGYLCPPIPGRADYIHYAADLLASANAQKVPTGTKIKVLDIGIGANCIYPIIGNASYGWSFVGSDIEIGAIKSAKNIVQANANLGKHIEIRQQTDKTSIFKNIIHKQEKFHLSICNPPFHASAAEASAGSQRKNTNLGFKKAATPVLNFGGKNAELWTKGGEIGFITKMIDESLLFKNQCLWFTTLVSKSENLGGITAMLNRASALDVRIAEMRTGNKLTRLVAWTFIPAAQHANW